MSNIASTLRYLTGVAATLAACSPSSGAEPRLANKKIDPPPYELEPFIEEYKYLRGALRARFLELADFFSGTRPVSGAAINRVLAKHTRSDSRFKLKAKRRGESDQLCLDISYANARPRVFESEIETQSKQVRCRRSFLSLAREPSLGVCRQSRSGIHPESGEPLSELTEAEFDAVHHQIDQLIAGVVDGRFLVDVYVPTKRIDDIRRPAQGDTDSEETAPITGSLYNYWPELQPLEDIANHWEADENQRCLLTDAFPKPFGTEEVRRPIYYVFKVETGDGVEVDGVHLLLGTTRRRNDTDEQKPWPYMLLLGLENLRWLIQLNGETTGIWPRIELADRPSRDKVVEEAEKRSIDKPCLPDAETGTFWVKLD